MVTHNIAQTGIKHPDFTPEIDTYALLLQENPRVFDDARVGSHYAIVPTGFVYSAADDVELYYGELSPNELQNILGSEAFNIFNLVVLRTLAALYPAAEYAVIVNMIYFSYKAASCRQYTQYGKASQRRMRNKAY